MGQNAKTAVPSLIGLLRDTERTSSSISVGDDQTIRIFTTFSNPRERAANALAIIKDPRAIGPLIEVLDLDAQYGGWGAAESALEEITGQSFGRNKNLWKAWHAGTIPAEPEIMEALRRTCIARLGVSETKVTKLEIHIREFDPTNQMCQAVWNYNVRQADALTTLGGSMNWFRISKQGTNWITTIVEK
jgi:hypothetical protein